VRDIRASGSFTKTPLWMQVLAGGPGAPAGEGAPGLLVKGNDAKGIGRPVVEALRDYPIALPHGIE